MHTVCIEIQMNLRAQIESFARTAVGNHAIGGADLLRLRLPLPP